MKAIFCSFKARSHKEIANYFTNYLELVILQQEDKDVKSDTGRNAHIDNENFRASEEAKSQKRVSCHHQLNEASVQDFMSLRVKLFLLKELP